MMHLDFLLRKGKAEPYKKISFNVFQEIEREIKTEKHLISVGAESLESSYDTGHAVMVFDGTRPVAYTRLSFLHGGDDDLGVWMELGSTWVRMEYRKKKINRDMYSLLLPSHRDLNILATTTNLRSLEIGQEFGFVPVQRQDLPPFVWRESCSLCPQHKTRALSKDNTDCRLAHGEAQREGSMRCWFRVTPETAKRHNLKPYAT